MKKFIEWDKEPIYESINEYGKLMCKVFESKCGRYLLVIEGDINGYYEIPSVFDLEKMVKIGGSGDQSFAHYRK